MKTFSIDTNEPVTFVQLVVDNPDTFSEDDIEAIQGMEVGDELFFGIGVGLKRVS